MRYFVFDQEGMATSLAFRLSYFEGNEVMFFSQAMGGREHLENMVPLAQSMDEGLRFIGKEGRFICGDEQDCTPYRKRGHKGYGGNAFTNKLENNRMFEMEIAKKCGIAIPNFHHVESAKEAIKFIKAKPDQYVLKQTGHAPKAWNYVGKEEGGRDVIDQLEWIAHQPEFKKMNNIPFMLQEFCEGLEFGCSAWWAYDDWLRTPDGLPIIELNREHKKQGNCDTGLTTGEMGTVMILTTKSKLFDEVLDKLTPVLKQYASDVCINIDVNCGIVEEKGKPKTYLYEITPREGYPACALSQYLLDIEIGSFFSKIIDKTEGDVKWKSGWGVTTVLGAGQFPHEGSQHEGTFKDQPVRLPFPVEEWDDHVSPLYIKYDKDRDFCRIADYYEYVVAVSYHDADISIANQKCVNMMKEIDVRAPQYRTDIGQKFQAEEVDKLTEWGYIPSKEK